MGSCDYRNCCWHLHAYYCVACTAVRRAPRTGLGNCGHTRAECCGVFAAKHSVSEWDRRRRPDDGSGDLLIGIIDFVLRLLVTSGIALLLVSNTTLLSIIIGVAITSVLLFVFEKPWQRGMTDAQLHEASKKAVELGVQMLEEERVKRAR